MLTFQSRLRLLEKVTEKFLPPFFFFSFHTYFAYFPPNCSFEKEIKKKKKTKKTLPACLELQTGSRELMCLLRGSDILALQEVQLQHHQLLQMLDWFGSVRPSVSSTTVSVDQPSPPDGPNTTKPSRKWKQSVSESAFLSGGKETRVRRPELAPPSRRSSAVRLQGPDAGDKHPQVHCGRSMEERYRVRAVRAIHP